MLPLAASISPMMLLAAAAFCCPATASAQEFSTATAASELASIACPGAIVPLRRSLNPALSGSNVEFTIANALQPPGQDSLVSVLVHWVGKHTQYDISGALLKPPTISFCKIGDEISYERKDLIVEQPVVAMYDVKERRIYLVRPWTAKNVRHVSTLLHEIVHDVQLLNKRWPCWGDAEREAYRLQERWLKEQGQDPDFNWTEIFLRTRCGRDIHP